MNHQWTALEIKALKISYSNTPSKIIAQRLGVSVYAVYNQAFLLGLKKSKAYLRENWEMIQPGLGYGFKKGCIPWNKGVKSA